MVCGRINMIIICKPTYLKSGINFSYKAKTFLEKNKAIGDELNKCIDYEQSL